MKLIASLFQTFTGRHGARPPGGKGTAVAGKGAPLSVIHGLVADGRLDEAEQLLQRLLAHEPGHVDALHFLGLLSHQQGRTEEAIRHLEQAVALAPGAAYVQSNFAEVLRAAGHPGRAEAHAQWALQLDADRPQYLLNLAVILLDLRRFADALPVLDKALAIDPDNLPALDAKARALAETGSLADAIELATKTLAVEPGNTTRFMALRDYRARACDWSHYDDDVRTLLALLDNHAESLARQPLPGVHPLALCLAPVPPATIKHVAEQFASAARERAGPPLPRRTRGSRKPLRIGYLSADFHSHPTMHLMASLFALHDRKRVEITAWSLGPDDGSAYRKALVRDVDRFIDLRPESYRQAALRIREAEVDVLVDLKGFTYDARPEILALRPAPIQIAWLGYPGTTGAGLNDYALVDAVTVPPGTGNDFVEQLIRLPGSYQVNDYRQPIDGVVPSRSELGLPEDAFVFACFNHVHKIEPVAFSLWMDILSAVRGSVLWLYCSDKTARRNLREAAQRAGLSPERVVFGDTLPKPKHLARLSRADLFLDTMVYNAHTSASDALWAGVPVLTCPGEAFASRVAASLVSAAGLPSLACSSLAQYRQKAIHLANHPEELAALRSVLNAREELPLFDTPRFARLLETAFETAWHRHHEGLPPASFAVSEP